MSSSADPAAEDPPPDLVAVGDYTGPQEAADRGLVILAMGLAYWLMPAPDRFTVLVPTAHAAAVREQLSRYEQECLHWPPAPLPQENLRHARPRLSPLLWALSVFVAFWLQRQHPAWVAAGELDASAIFDRGQLWRVATALFLHADVGHLISNVAAGTFVFSAVLGTLGGIRGWFSLALAALCGNAVSAALHYPAPYHSLGASTAVFAGLGLLTGHAVARAQPASARASIRAVLGPLGAGVTLLALYGAGGHQVDLGAHLSGFAAGLLLGLLHGRGGERRPPRLVETA